jgi:hypothetical protein
VLANIYRIMVLLVSHTSARRLLTWVALINSTKAQNELYPSTFSNTILDTRIIVEDNP